MNVFRKLQIKIIVNILLVHAIILAVLLGLLNYYIYASNSREAIACLDQLLKNDMRDVVAFENYPPPFRFGSGIKPLFGFPPPPDAVRGRKRFDIHGLLFPVDPGVFDIHNYFAIQVSSSGNIEKIVDQLHLRVAENDIKDIAANIYAACRSGTFQGGYQGMFWKAKKYGDGYLACFLDRAGELGVERRLIFGSICIYGISLVFALLFGWILALWTVYPVKEDFERQKQFIADAGHELKTPIAVIGANIDVLISTYPENKWLNYIKAENQRMGELVKNMLYLAKADANRQTLELSEFDLCAAVNSVVLPFEGTFYEQGKHFELDVPESSVMMYGDEQKIKQLVIILVDNAIKNSEKDAFVRVSITASGNRRVIKVYNTGHGIASDDIDKIFERFYRADTSRARQTGGYGLGLAIARSIAAAHNGTLSVTSEVEHWAEFTLDIPSGFTHRHNSYSCGGSNTLHIGT